MLEQMTEIPMQEVVELSSQVPHSRVVEITILNILTRETVTKEGYVSDLIADYPDPDYDGF